jgi:hypothetical protein
MISFMVLIANLVDGKASIGDIQQILGGSGVAPTNEYHL